MITNLRQFLKSCLAFGIAPVHLASKAKIRDVKAGGKGNISVDTKRIQKALDAMQCNAVGKFALQIICPSLLRAISCLLPFRFDYSWNATSNAKCQCLSRRCGQIRPSTSGRALDDGRKFYHIEGPTELTGTQTGTVLVYYSL